MSVLTYKTLLESLIEGEGYGLQIRDRIANKYKLSTWQRDTLNIYHQMRELEVLGYVSCRITEPLAERGNRPRYYYSLTEKGRYYIENEMIKK